ncbi:MAG: hypothetical protein K0R54_4337 [Clostridiaceae bacterium]|jgi:hypothetical protein|nr:hypothetical protein [Clostridiaceae bacterium]
MKRSKIISIIPKEGRTNIIEARKRLNKLLEMTQCIICKENKPLSEFAEDKNGYLGFSNICKVCSDTIEYPHTQNKCKKCGEYKSYNNFYKIRRQGYYKYCIECTKKMINEKAAAGLKKQCTSCNKIMPASTEYFYVTVTCSDLLKPICRVCYDKKKKELRNKRNK